LFSFVNRNR